MSSNKLEEKHFKVVHGEVVVAMWAEWSLPTKKIRGLNLTIGKIFKI